MTILSVGSDQQYSTIAAAVQAAQDGDTVEVQAGTYTNDFARVTSQITLTAVGGPVNLVATEQPPNGKGILDTYASTVVNGFTFSGAVVQDNNGAGIRSNAGDLTVENCVFSNNQDGILVNADPNATITIKDSEFAFNGAGDGYSHNLYVGAVKALVIDNSYFHDANIGHEVKSRALSTTITNSRIIDGSGSASYSVDLPNGGTAVLTGNVIEKGPSAQNQTIVHFGGESVPYAGSSLVMTGNVIVNDRVGVTGLVNAAGSPAQVTGNTFYGVTAEQFGIVDGSNTVVADRPALDLTTQVTDPAAAPAVPVTLVDVPAGAQYVDYGRAGAVVASGHILHVGASEAFTSLQSALAISVDGDTVQVDAGTYTDDFATATHQVIIEGVGGMAHFVADRIGENDVGLLDVQASVTVRNLIFSGARSYEGNGAGMRVRAGDVTIVNSVFTGNDVSVLANGDTTLGIYDTEIAANGNSDKATHNLNVGAVGSFTLDNSYVHGGLVAHEVNDRAFFSRIENNRIVDTEESGASFAINLGLGGTALIQGNVIEKGQNAVNGILVHAGGEGPLYSNTNVQVLGNTLVSDIQNTDYPYTYFVVGENGAAVTVDGNTFVGGVPGSEQARGAVSTNATVAPSAMISADLPWVAPAFVSATPGSGGPDTLTLQFQTTMLYAPAQVTVLVDGAAVGGGAVQPDMTWHGDWGGGTHTVTVNEINGHYGTSVQGGDTRVLQAALNGVTVDGGDNNLVWSPLALTIQTPSRAMAASDAVADPLAQTPLFDATYYLAHNPDVAASGVDPLAHFESNGWAERRDPSAAFSDAQYLDAYADVKAAHVDPLLHYIQVGQAEGRQAFAVEAVAPPPSPPVPLPPSPEAQLFDAQYYLAHNPDVAAAGIDPFTHFVSSGWAEGRDPSAAFSEAKYLDAYADVKAAHIDPLLHYAQLGQAEGRQAFAVEAAAPPPSPPPSPPAPLPPSPEAQLFDAQYYLAHNPDVAAAGIDPFTHFVSNGWAEGRDPSAAFSEAKYLNAYADVQAAHLDPLMHYALFGRAEGRMAFAVDAPAPPPPTAEAQLFDAQYYLSHNPDVAAAHVDPLLHYETNGWTEGRDPSAAFSTTQYLSHYADVATAHIDPLAHFAQLGQAEGRQSFAV